MYILVFYLFHNFRSHPTRSAYESMSHFFSWNISSCCQPSWYTKICNLNSAIFTQENIASFNIPAKYYIECNTLKVSNIHLWIWPLLWKYSSPLSTSLKTVAIVASSKTPCLQFVAFILCLMISNRLPPNMKNNNTGNKQ